MDGVEGAVRELPIRMHLLITCQLLPGVAIEQNDAALIGDHNNVVAIGGDGVALFFDFGDEEGLLGEQVPFKDVPITPTRKQDVGIVGVLTH